MGVPPALWTLGLATALTAVVLLVAAWASEKRSRRRSGPIGAGLPQDHVKIRPGLCALGFLGGLLGLLAGLTLSGRSRGPGSSPTLWRLGLASAGIAVVLLVAAWAKEEIRNRRQAPISAALERDLGSRLGTPYLEGDEVVMIMEVEPGKPMDEAGVEARDVVTGYDDTRDFFDDLQESRGASFTLSLVRNGNPLQLLVSVPPGPPAQ